MNLRDRRAIQSPPNGSLRVASKGQRPATAHQPQGFLSRDVDTAGLGMPHGSPPDGLPDESGPAVSAHLERCFYVAEWRG